MPGKRALTICVLKGDGIGPEICGEAVKVLQAACTAREIDLTLDYQLIGGAAFDIQGTPLPQETVSACRQADAVLLGAVGGGKWDELPPHERPEQGLLGIRSKLGLFCNLRPVRVYKSLMKDSPLHASLASGIDLMVVRELTSGIYFGDHTEETVDGEIVARDVMQYSRHEIERVAKVAFDMAGKRRGKLTSVDKANVLAVSKLWRRVVSELSENYPQVEVDHLYVDNTAMQLIVNPGQFDVILTGNMFGDILSDEASMIAGSIGMLPSASIGSSRLGLYEPIHGSAPDIAGQGVANPLATILSVAMMMRYSLDLPEIAEAVEQACEESLDIGRTPDLWCDGIERWNTVQAGNWVSKRVSELLA